VTRILLDARKARDFGIGAYVLGLIGGLARRGGFELAAVVRPEDANLFPAGVTRIVSDALNYSLGELMSVRNAIGLAKPDIFHAPHYVVPFFPPRATVVTIHDLMHLDRPEHASPAKRAYARWMLGRAVKAAARIITVSQATKKDLTTAFPGATVKVVVIPDGVGELFFKEREREPASKAARERYGLASSPYLLFLGNDKPHKNLAGLLDGLALLFQSSLSQKTPAVPPVSLVLAGGAAERVAERKRAIKARGLSGSVTDLGIVPASDVPSLLAGAAALVLPSLAEGFGIPVLEAQAVGTPVVCSDRGGLREAAGNAAVYIDPEKPASIAQALERVLTDEGLREMLRKEGKERAKLFTWDAVAEKTAEVYEDVLRGSPSSFLRKPPVVSP
jgi:glycosyltransferase involved in cell wall biosynthesis